MAAKKKVKPNATVKSALNLREAPSKDAKKLCIMGEGEEIIATPIEEDPNWCAVKFMDLEGFAMTEFIEFK